MRTLASRSLADINFDKDGALYTITGLEMKPQRQTALREAFRLEAGSGLRGWWCRIYRVTKNPARDSLDPRNQRRIEKYGYHPGDEWTKQLLFRVRKGVWVDAEGKKVAIEQGGAERQFQIAGKVEGAQRDLLVSCWVMREWIDRGVRWEGD
jgi:hypothetical protein